MGGRLGVLEATTAAALRAKLLESLRATMKGSTKVIVLCFAALVAMAGGYFLYDAIRPPTDDEIRARRSGLTLHEFRRNQDLIHTISDGKKLDSRQIDTVRQILSEPETERGLSLKMTALGSLAAVTSERRSEALELIRPYLTHEDQYVRSVAFMSYRRLDAPDLRDVAATLLNDENEVITRAAREILQGVPVRPR